MENSLQLPPGAEALIKEESLQASLDVFEGVEKKLSAAHQRVASLLDILEDENKQLQRRVGQFQVIEAEGGE